MSDHAQTAQRHDGQPPVCYGTSVASIVHLHHGKPVTDSVTIANEFGRRHDNVLQSLDGLIADGTISRLEFKERDYIDARGKKQRMIELTEAGALIAMPFIGGKKSRLGQVRLVNAFLSMRDEIAGNPGDWLESRKRVSVGYLALTGSLQETRADDGKETKPVHYMAEAKLVNWVLFGKFEGVDRDQLSHGDLKLLEAIEIRDAFLIARGRTYEQRKTDLPAYLQSIRAKQARVAQ